MFQETKCPTCGDTLNGLQITEEQRRWLDLVKVTVIEHMKYLESLPENERLTPDNQGWQAISEAFLFTYGYMVSREDKKDS